MQKKAIIFLLYIIGSLLLCSPAPGELIGSNFQIDVTGGCRFPDVTFSTVDNKYLVVWSDYGATPVTVKGRFVTNAGAAVGSAFPISTEANPVNGLLPAVCYNPTDNEFLVTWVHVGAVDTIYGRRISSSSESLLGSSFLIGTVGGSSTPAMSWNAATNTYLVTFSNYSEVFFQRVSNTGSLLGGNVNISNDSDFSGLPAACSDNGTQILVTWDHGLPNNSGYIRGQRVNATNGSLIGGFIDLTTLGGENRSMIDFDPANNRWCVEYQEQVTGGNGYDQYGRFVTTGGVVTGSPIPFATGPGLQGDTLWGCDIAFIPNLGGRYFVSYATNNGQGAQETDANGNQIGGPITLGTGDYTSLSNAADPALNRWLAVWEAHITPSGPHHIYGQLYQATDLAPPALVTNFTTTPGSGQLTLNWTNPSDSDFAGTVIRWKLGSYPAHLADGTFLVDNPNTPGSNDSYVHMGLTGGVTYYYSAFTYDQQSPNPNYSSGAHASGIPAVKGDFDLDTDVDQKDFGHLQNCFSGTGVPYASGCSDADFDVDGDVDSADFTTFDGCMKGADQTPGC